MDNDAFANSEIKIEEVDISNSCESDKTESPSFFYKCEDETSFNNSKNRNLKRCSKYNPIQYKSQFTWQEYITRENNFKTYYCSQCPFETKWECYLKNHVKKIHATPEESKFFHCMNCSFKTKWKFSLSNHMKVHSTPDQLKMHKCSKCDYQTKWNNGLTSHMKVHLLPKIIKIKIYKCSQCCFECKSKQQLTDHRRNEHASGDTVYKCPLCSFTTKFRHGVNKHVKVHNMAKLM